MSAPPVLLSVSDNVARVALNQPDKGHSIHPTTVEALMAAATRCGVDQSVRCISLTIAGTD